METLGNISLLERRKIGYFASGTIASLSVLPTLDWAALVAKRSDIAVVSGFRSKMEREVLDFLLRGQCAIICVLARSMYTRPPMKFREAFKAGRVLFVSPYKSAAVRASHTGCHQCNKYVASISDELVFSSLTPQSSLYPLAEEKELVVKL